MKKILISAMLFGSILTIQSQGVAQKNGADKDYQKVEADFASATHVENLKTDDGFMAALKRVISRGDANSAQTIAAHSTFIFMNGMLGDVASSIDKMPAKLKDSATGMKAIDAYYSVRSMGVGDKVPDFTLPTTDGKTINFYTFIKDKKCVVLDFWASWCVWCRKENPFVKTAYDTYRGKGADVIGVSLDEKDPAWRKALAEDKPTWTQVLEKRGTKEGLYKWFDLNGIPAIFLIDSKGCIVAKGLRGDNISNSIKDYLENNK